MNTKTKAGVWLLAMGMIGAGIFFANSARAATITSVSPEDVWADEAYTVALTGSGFDDATGMTLFRHTDYTPADEIRTVNVDFDVFSDDSAEIYVPAGLRTGWYDIWIDGNDGGGELENALWIGSTALSNVTELNYTSSKKAKVAMNIEFKGLVLGKKTGWTTIKFNGRKVKVKRVTNSGNNSTATVELKYRKWPTGSYSLSVKYKNQVREEIDKGDKTTYKKRWVNDSETYNDIFEIK
jgi:hypothetical protein